MYQRLSIHSAGVCCGYIENVELARRPAGTPGVRHPVLERALYMQLPDPCSAEAFAVSHNARMAGDPVFFQQQMTDLYAAFIRNTTQG